MGVNTSDGTICPFGIEYRNCRHWSWRCFGVTGASSYHLRLLWLLVLLPLAVSTFTGCQPCPGAQCTCEVDSTTAFSSPIAGLTLVVASDTPRLLVYSELNFTAAVQSGTPQRYEWTSSDNWTAESVEPYVHRRYSKPGNHSMTVNASNTLGYRMTSVNFTVHQRTEARLTYYQVPRTAVVGQTFVMSMSVEANMYSLLNCSLFLGNESIGNFSYSDAAVCCRGRYVVSVTVEVQLDVSGKHRVKLEAIDIAYGETSTFVWYIDAFDAVVDVIIDLPKPAIATGSRMAFTARHLGGGGTVTYLWNFGDQSAMVDTGASPSSPAHAYTQPGTYAVRVTASNSVSRVTGTATLNVVDTISGVRLAYDGPTSLGHDTFIKAVVGAGTQVTYNFSVPGTTTLARSEDAVVVRYSNAGQHEVTVLAFNAVSNGSVSLMIHVVDASTLIVLGVGNATCGLPLHSVVTFHADVVCANTSDVAFHWSIPNVLSSSGRGLSSVSAMFSEAGVYDLNLTVRDDAAGVRREYRRILCANETVPEESFDLEEPSIGISRVGAPYLPAEHDIVFFPIMNHCMFICSFHWQFWDSTSPTNIQGFKVQHQFQNSGVFNVSLAVERLFIRKTTYTTVVVQRRIDKALLRATVETSSTDEPIEFIVTTQPDDEEAGKLTYRWSFYDDPNVNYVGNSSKVTYAFHSEGIRRVEVIVNNNVSALTANTSVNIYSEITGLTFTGCCGRVFNTTVQFEASVQTGQISSYHWILRDDDGVTLRQSAKQVFTYAFAATGHYQIQMTAENPLSNQTVVDHFTVQVSRVTIHTVI